MLPNSVENTDVGEANILIISDQEKIKFENIQKKYVCDPANPSSLSIEYIMDKDVRPCTRNWIGLFPRGWSHLLHNVAFEYVAGRAFNEQENKFKVLMSLKFVKKDLYHPEFQFVFVNSDLQVLGTSSYFRFYKSEADAEEAQKFSTKKVKPEVQLLDKPQVSENHTELVLKRGNKFAKVNDEYENQISLPLVRSSVSDHSLNFCRNVAYKTNCNNCGRLPDILNTQHNLFQEVKYLAEAKRDLEEYVSVLENKLELAIAAQKKLRLVAEYEKQEKITFQAIMNTVLKQYSESSIMRVSNGNFEVVVQPMISPLNYSQFHRKSKFGAVSSSVMKRHLEMKAIIGSQNEKLCIMASKISQLQAEYEDTIKRKTDAWKVTTQELNTEVPLVEVATDDLIPKQSLDLNNND